MNEVIIQMVEKPQFMSTTSVETREEAIKICLKQISNLSQEAVIAINFDAKFVPINWCLISLGTPDRAICRPADFWKSAILSNAKYTICAHNHPVPGDIAPSSADLDIAKDLAIAGWHIGIVLWDFLIAQGDRYMSFIDNCPEYVNVNIILGKQENGEAPA